ncbi:MAG: cytidylate kinase-like family protein [Prevotella sp.]|jgi:cytidylate kinase|nr:cytidylate kinase-like family protein [Prevotella sp.]MBQ5548555.1 cytidylate kinase-like family protein [Prevotella sp.]MBR2097975.1 cytidylate kinase-like family protein [Prevotella sp.]
MNKNEKFVITINREVGTGGRTVGRKLAEKLGVKYCDKAVIDGLTQKFGLSPERIEEIKAQKKSWWNDINNYYQTLVGSASMPMEAEVKLDNASMFETEKQILQNLAAHESCVVAGRTGFMVFREWPNHLNVFIQASMAYRIQRVMRRQKVSEQEARDIIAKMDATREAYIKKYEDTSRYDTRNYQLVISMDDLSEDDAAEIILDYIDRTSK